MKLTTRPDDEIMIKEIAEIIRGTSGKMTNSYRTAKAVWKYLEDHLPKKSNVILKQQ